MHMLQWATPRVLFYLQHFQKPMKTLRFFAAFVALLAAHTFVSASETSDNFAKWVPNFAASDMNQRKDAQQDWQNFCRQNGNDPDVRKEIMRVSAEQLAKDNPVDTTVWIVRQLGIVGDTTAVPTLAKCLSSNEVRIRGEAARALANISGTEAEEALKKVATAETKDALTARTIKANVPNNREAETQFPQAIPYIPFARGADIASWMEGYSKLSDMEKAQALSNLTVRSQNMQIRFAQRRIRNAPANAERRQGTQRGQGGMRANPYLPFALEAAQSSDETLRNAGILAVGALGGRAEVPFLLEQSRTGANKDLAKVALSRMSRRGIDDLLLENLKSEQDNEKFLILADVLSRRYNTNMRSILLEKAGTTDSPNRLQLLQLAEPLSTKNDLEDYVKAWTLITDRRQKDQAEQIIARLSEGDASSVLQALGNNWETPDALMLLGRVGDAHTLEQIRKSTNAIYALRNWTDAKVADDLLAIVVDAKYSDEDRISSLRAFIRVISLPNDRIGIRINDTEKVGRLTEAFALAKRVDEKRLIIERVGQIRTIDSLRFILKYMDDAELQERVCQSVLDLAHHVDFKRSAKDEFNAALDKVLTVTKRNDFRDRANRYKTQQ